PAIDRLSLPTLFRSRTVGVPDDTVPIDDEHAPAREPDRPERAVGRGHLLVDVGQQREVEAVLAGELVVALDALRRDPDDLRVELDRKSTRLNSSHVK